jgi:hypothetical protein
LIFLERESKHFCQQNYGTHAIPNAIIFKYFAHLYNWKYLLSLALLKIISNTIIVIYATSQ